MNLALPQRCRCSNRKPVLVYWRTGWLQAQISAEMAGNAGLRSLFPGGAMPGADATFIANQQLLATLSPTLSTWSGVLGGLPFHRGNSIHYMPLKLNSWQAPP